MIDTLTTLKLLSPWQNGEELDDAVFRIAATLPLRELKHKSYKIPGDENFGFDPNAFVQRLIEETGISHVWEQVSLKVPEGQRNFALFEEGSPGEDPNIVARREARQLLWEIWSRFTKLSELLPRLGCSAVAGLFADFLLDNIDLVRQLECSFRDGKGSDGVDLLTELERRAQGRV
jgi:hypothetical protein